MKAVLDHVGIAVTDLERSLEFRDALCLGLAASKTCRRSDRAQLSHGRVFSVAAAATHDSSIAKFRDTRAGSASHP